MELDISNQLALKSASLAHQTVRTVLVLQTTALPAILTPPSLCLQETPALLHAARFNTRMELAA